MHDFLASTTRKHLLREETIGATRRVVDLARGSEAGPHSTSAPPRPVVSLKTLYTDFEVRELPAFYGNGTPLRLELESNGSDRCGGGVKTDQSEHAATTQQSDTPGDGKRSREVNEDDDERKTSTVTAAQPPSSVPPGSSSNSVADTIGPLVSPNDLAALLAGLAEEAKSIPLPSVTDKERRGQLHAAIKACLGATHVSNTVDGVVCVVRANATDRREARRRSRAQRPPPVYHHFTLYKENTDSNQALRMIAAHLKLSSRQVQFCGTKDKRAVTLQRVAIRETTVERLKSINARTFGLHNVIKVCGFTQEDHGLRLGDAKGNHFRIALRVFPNHDADASGCAAYESAEPSAALTADYLQEVENVVQRYGVVNYFGPQRFGTTDVLTSDVGIQFLRGNLLEGLRLLLASKATIVPEMAKVVELFQAGNYTEALQRAPYYCYQERDVLKHLSANPNDYLGALRSMARTMAMMYFHAVQSLVWNRMASARLSGPERIHAEVGDLVLESTYEARLSGKEDDGAGTAITAADDDAAAGDLKMPTVRKLTSEEECSRFTLADVLLPVPGPDQGLVYPEASGCSRADYEKVLQELGIDFQGKEALSLIKVFHFYGTYRALGVRPKDFELRLQTAASWRTPVLRSDWELFCAQQPHTELPSSTNATAEVVASEPKGVVQVLVAAFSLPPGSYATSVLREFCIPSADAFPSSEAAQDA
ncbi:hypothetical protein ABB37_03999 [Leptomonas pyrrhocoris]|uniref:TRUD domain-containing protein n=1 Tax=Leptomonas pyrrhocoris TaxID=157538 RepID=A0A0N0VFS1_LEPPY|nr:hypothetical protein ABB37_03999 [Leptomonas pyrrhocoris]KPA81694.1 hypothetical protein ABB37_03999 [Leptomonas pyrrhocoris]|eukprot:XP_015660133.1 hypothetical protein ABB37_03999 [Leptomonas pyrrhocoris]